MAELAVYDNDPTLYLFTSLTAGSSHIVTATSRIETILKANKISFKGVDTATDDLARKLFQRRARGKKLPLLVKEGYVIADLEQIEEWNEYDELKDVLGSSAAPAPVKAAPAPAAAPATSTPPVDKKENEPSANAEQNLAIRQLGAEAAKVAAAKKHVPEKITTTNPLLSEKINSPAVATPTKAADPSSILSPRSIPLPSTPNPASTATASPMASQPAASSIPKITSKPVHSPPSMHVDAANPALGAAPTSSTTASSTTRPSPSPLPAGSPGSGSGVTSPMTSYHGRSLSSPGAEEIKQVEKQQSIAEATSSDEEDDEDEKVEKVVSKEAVKLDGEDNVKKTEPEDDESEDGSEDESEEESEEDVKKDEVKEDGKAEAKVEDKPVETQKQSAKDADKAGVSVED